MLGMGDKSRQKSGRGNHQGVDTLIGPGVTIRGDLECSGGCYIEGSIYGKVCAAEGSAAVITVAENGHVEGEIRAPVVIINGRMTGDVHAGERVELAAQARVQGNIHYKLVEMAAGAMITGRLIHENTPLASLTAIANESPKAATKRLAAPEDGAS